MARALAYFVSSHGFGHAARAAAVIGRLCARDPELHIELFTGAPRWFFEESFAGSNSPMAKGNVRYRSCQTDIGLVQASALVENLDATVNRLKEWLPLRDQVVDSAAMLTEAGGADLVVADISPLGLKVAQQIRIPSVLIENFTWDWIYRGYDEPVLEPFAQILEPIFEAATLRLKATPYCEAFTDDEGTHAQTIGPIARPPRLSRETTRNTLGIPKDAPLVLVTMGGVPWQFHELEAHLHRYGAGLDPSLHLVVAGGANEPTRLGKTLLIPHQSNYYHPDLVHASDAVIGKLGYSTVAEVAQAGCRLGYIPRPRFPESPRLESWVQDHLSCRKFDPDHLENGTWLTGLTALLEQPAMLKQPRRPRLKNGADEAAKAILDRLD